ncbi:MAG TPA: ABC transporter ATP-binding protein [Actinocrinis sp.]|nr:ABC transporter ATP-binding protein [Actinocrinis sp.]
MTEPNPPIVDVRGLTVHYGRHRRPGRSPAVLDLDLTIAPGERVAIVGESGSGKTTTANALCGLLPDSAQITAGRIEVAGLEVTGATERGLRRIRGAIVGLVPQDPMVALNPTLRVGTQVAEAVRRRGGVDRRQLSAEVVASLERAGLDDPVLRARQYPHELSGGMRQRVLIAIALAAEPRLLIADEPTSALDVTLQRRILDHLDALVSEAGISLLIITHDLGVAADRADRVLVMQNGRVVEEGLPAQVLVDPRHGYSRQLVAAAPGLSPRLVGLGGALGGVPAAGAGDGPSAATSPQAPGGSSTLGAPAASPHEILRLDHLTKDFPLPRSPGAARTHRAVDDVSLTVPPGRTLGLVGESGSGKTTVLRLALGLETPSAGTVTFDGAQISGRTWTQTRALRRRFQLVHQNPFASLDPRFSVEQSIAEPLASFRLGDGAARAARVSELLDQVALPQTARRRRPAELSGGQRQRVAIARALAPRPDLLLLDEPVSALDVRVQAQILDLLADLQRDLGVAYLFVSHDLAVVARLAHEVAVMRAGRVIEHGDTRTVFTEPATDYTRDLLDAIPGRRTAGRAR